jgi:hypothetical protein
MQWMLDTGCWPSGHPLTEDERRDVYWNLELARRERAEIHAHAGDRASSRPSPGGRTAPVAGRAPLS